MAFILKQTRMFPNLHKNSVFKDSEHCVNCFDNQYNHLIQFVDRKEYWHNLRRNSYL